jgi:hypothetical protein
LKAADERCHTLEMKLALFFTFVFSNALQAASLKPFQSDGCTMFMDGPVGKPNLWKHCCFEHDLRYWFGGSDQQMKQTDLFLKACVKDAADGFWAGLIYNGVVAGHSSPVKSKYHWSWAWEPKREEKELSVSEKIYVESELAKLGLDPKYLQEFIKKYLRP